MLLMLQTGRNIMLAISGAAESMQENPEKNISKGSFYAFSLFSDNDQLDEQLDNIENYMTSLGWDNIIIMEQEVIDAKNIKHQIIQKAIAQAKVEGIAGVFDNTPISAA